MPAGPPEDEIPDIELMSRVKEGDRLAFRVLVERHQFRVVGTVTRMLGSDRDSEDVAQEVFVRVWKSAKRYVPSAKFTTWLMTITRNLVFNAVRRQKRAVFVSLDAQEGEQHSRQMADEQQTTPEQDLRMKELQDAVDGAIRALPEQQRLAVILRRYEELSYEEIATVLKTSVPAVKSMLFRARAELREVLGRYLEE